MSNNTRFSRIERGVTLVEVMVSLAVVSISAIAFLTLFENQVKSNNFLTFKNKTEQIRVSTMSQFLNNPFNCACMFGGATFPLVGAPQVLPPAPVDRITPRIFGTPPLCTAPFSSPIITSVAADGLLLSPVNPVVLRGLTPLVPNITYRGRFRINVSTSQAVFGPSTIFLDIPVSVNVTAAGGLATIVNCTTAADFFTDALLANNGYVVFPNGLIIQWGRAIANANNQTTITFPRPFTQIPFSITVSGSNDAGSNAKDNWPDLYNHPANTTINTFRVTSAEDFNVTISWMAIGR